jgi:hypothetical protein
MPVIWLELKKKVIPGQTMRKRKADWTKLLTTNSKIEPNTGLFFLSYKRKSERSLSSYLIFTPARRTATHARPHHCCGRSQAYPCRDHRAHTTQARTGFSKRRNRKNIGLKYGAIWNPIWIQNAGFLWRSWLDVAHKKYRKKLAGRIY